MAADKKTIGITKANAAPLSQLVTAGQFGSELDAAKFAMSYAITQGTPAGIADGAETKWNVGSVDPDGSLRSLIEALFPDETEPYRLTEHLMNEGIRGLTDLLEEGGDIYEILFPAA
jgi:hypothetical protein